MKTKESTLATLFGGNVDYPFVIIQTDGKTYRGTQSGKFATTGYWYGHKTTCGENKAIADMLREAVEPRMREFITDDTVLIRLTSLRQVGIGEMGQALHEQDDMWMAAWEAKLSDLCPWAAELELYPEEL